MCNNEDKTLYELSTEEYMVAFIDILGSSKMIENDSIGSLNLVHQVFENALNHYKQGLMFIRHPVFEDNYSEKVDIRIFSDNIVLYTKIGRSIRDCFIHFVFLAGFMQSLFLKKGLLVRGGVSKGDFYADDIMIWGNALVNAHKIEDSIAIYPRIVIQPSIIYSVGEEFAHAFECLSIDEDGCYYVDYLGESIFPDLSTAVANARKNCELQLQNAGYNTDKENLKIVQKLLWQRSYIDRCEKKMNSPNF